MTSSSSSVSSRCLTEEEIRELAAERAGTWLVWRRRQARGAAHMDFKVVTAESEKEALRKGGRWATAAHPFLGTRRLLALFGECGQPCKTKKRRR